MTRYILSLILYHGDAIKTFAKFNQYEAIVIKKSNDTPVLKAMRKALS